MFNPRSVFSFRHQPLGLLPTPLRGNTLGKRVHGQHFHRRAQADSIEIDRLNGLEPEILEGF